MDWLIYRDNVMESNDYKVSRQEVLDYMEEYTKTFSSQEKIRGYAAHLFSDSIDEDRLVNLVDYANGATNGHVLLIVDADEEKSIIDENDQSFWEWLWGTNKFEEVSYNPIVIVDSADIKLSKEDFCSKYYVNVEDYDGINGIKNAFQTAIDKGEQFVLFRFAVTDYYASVARFDSFNNDDLSDQDGYVAQETIFLDFDIISLTFRKESVDTVIGVVSDPFDIINGLDQPDNLQVQTEWWEKIIALLLLIVLLVILLPILSPIAISLISLILKGIVLIIKTILDVFTFPLRIIVNLFKKK